ncbi:MAG: hypothetical protein CMG60_08050 [Candidatus Marinimicrobia bacterium]|nr:hypothetical protein [Candidatus Neomarinimicrobiota bacterium]
MNQLILITISVFLFTILLNNIKNKSNFSKFIIIPVIVAMLTKYIVGDLDSGYTWSVIDIFYWLYIFVLSYILLLSMDYKFI